MQRPDEASAQTRADSSSAPSADTDHVVDAVLAASRAIVALSVRSLAVVADDVTLTQYRTLVVLASRGPQAVSTLAEELGVTAPTASRMCDRLVRDELVFRSPDPSDRRRVTVVLTTQGRELLDEVTKRRRTEIARVLANSPNAGWSAMVAGLHEFASAAGEVPEQQWDAGWDL